MPCNGGVRTRGDGILFVLFDIFVVLLAFPLLSFVLDAYDVQK